ncbi:hypothetical protein [Rhodoblastus sp.]|uniref:hypothetical protein n=1 Tax=Rhodoblastus sp. TaxID=1962975 RepID=UPI003F995C55
MSNQLNSLLAAALECSVFVEPLDPGLAYEELREVAKRANFQAGEINDCLQVLDKAVSASRRLIPSPAQRSIWCMFDAQEPDYRNFAALDFVYSQLNALVRSEGFAGAQIDRTVLVARAAEQGISAHDANVAVTYLVLADLIVERDGALRFPGRPGALGASVRPLPSEQAQQGRPAGARIRRQMATAYPLVQDVIARRSDGRRVQPEPLDAFAGELVKLGYPQFRMWWTQTVAEMRKSDPSSQSVSAAVLAAALVEGALTFIVKHGQTKGFFLSPDYDADPRKWKIENLVKSATNGASPILPSRLKPRVDALITTRQRIHAGRMLADYETTGVPDLRPDEAREALATAEAVVRAILDWLAVNP